MELLKKTLKESRSADQGEVHIIETDSKQNEITLVNVTNLFPNRFIRQVQNLKEKYKRRISGPDQEKIKMELHVEGDGSKHPKLYIEVDEHDGIMYFLMAKAMGLVIERENQTTGARVLSIITKDEDGFDNEPVDFGSSMSEVPDNLDVTMTNLIKNEVEYVLKHDGYKHTDKQKELLNTINTEIEPVKAEHGIDNPIYKLFLTSAKKAAKLIKGES